MITEELLELAALKLNAVEAIHEQGMDGSKEINELRIQISQTASLLVIARALNEMSLYKLRNVFNPDESNR